MAVTAAEETVSEELEEIKRRCEAAGLQFIEWEVDSYDEEDDLDEEDDPEYEASSELEEDTFRLSIKIPWGKDFTWLTLMSGPTARSLLNEPFEKYRLVEGFRALWSPELHTIECAFEPTNSPGTMFPLTVKGVRSPLTVKEAQRMTETFGHLDAVATPSFRQRVVLESDTDFSISIGPASNIYDKLRQFSVGSYLLLYPCTQTADQRSLTLQIDGIQVTTHDAAVELLQRVGDSMFELDLSLGLSLVPMREANPDTSRSSKKPVETVSSLPSIKFQYDRQPVSLYQYGKAASAMPLLQFLAYYQVLEFYFYRYLRRKAEREILDVLEEPPFKQLGDADKSRLLDVIRHRYEGSRKLGGSERDLLETTIKECVTPQDLRRFIVDNDDRYKFYTSTTAPKTLSRYVIPIMDASPDHRVSAAERIYDIRCRIVHAKTGFETQGPLFPFDPETANLRHDIDLVQFLARKAIEKARRPL